MAFLYANKAFDTLMVQTAADIVFFVILTVLYPIITAAAMWIGNRTAGKR